MIYKNGKKRIEISEVCPDCGGRLICRPGYRIGIESIRDMICFKCKYVSQKIRIPHKAVLLSKEEARDESLKKILQEPKKNWWNYKFFRIFVFK